MTTTRNTLIANGYRLNSINRVIRKNNKPKQERENGNTPDWEDIEEARYNFFFYSGQENQWSAKQPKRQDSPERLSCLWSPM